MSTNPAAETPRRGFRIHSVVGKSNRTRSSESRRVVRASGVERIGVRVCGIGFMGSAAGLGALLRLVSIGPTEIDREGNGVADLGIDATRLVTGSSRIGWRIQTISGVDRNDFHVNRISSATPSAEPMTSAEVWCDRFRAVFSIVPTPLASCDHPVSPSCTVLDTQPVREASKEFKHLFNLIGGLEETSIPLDFLLPLSARRCSVGENRASSNSLYDGPCDREPGEVRLPVSPTSPWRRWTAGPSHRTACRRYRTGTGEDERCSTAVQMPAGATGGVRRCGSTDSVAFGLSQRVPLTCPLPTL
jgi:hypothetical protein